MRGFLLSMAALLIVTAAWADPPEMSGAVVRFTESTLCVGDGDPWPCCTGAGEGVCNRFTLVMVDAPFLAMGGSTLPQMSDWCEGGPLFTQELESQWVLLDEGVIVTHGSADDWPVFVYQIDPECWLGDRKATLCCYIEDRMPIASGRVNFHFMDNDAFAWLTSVNRRNAWAIMLHGFVTVVATGESVPFSAHNNCNIKKHNAFACEDKIRVD